MSKDDVLREALSRLLGGDVQVLGMGDGEEPHDEMSEELDCGVQDTLVEKKTQLSLMPNESSSDEEFLRAGLKKIDDAAKGIFKEARLNELQEEASMLTKPDDFDLTAPEHEHTRLHIEERSMSIQIRKRDALIMRRFHDIVKKTLLPDGE